MYLKNQSASFNMPKMRQKSPPNKCIKCHPLKLSQGGEDLAFSVCMLFEENSFEKVGKKVCPVGCLSLVLLSFWHDKFATKFFQNPFLTWNYRCSNWLPEL